MKDLFRIILENLILESKRFRFVDEVNEKLIEDQTKKLHSKFCKEYDRDEITDPTKMHLLGSIEFKSLNNKNIEIPIYVDCDPEEPANMQYRTESSEEEYITINSAMSSNYYSASFSDSLYHEIIHAVDPKVKLLSAEFTDNQLDDIEYYLLPHEFDAFTSTFLKQFEKKLIKSPEKGKQEIKKIMKDLMSYLLTLSSKPLDNFENRVKEVGNKISDLFDFERYEKEYPSNVGGNQNIKAAVLGIVMHPGFRPEELAAYTTDKNVLKKYVQRVSDILLKY